MQRLYAQKETRPCLICSREGTRHAVEVLPDGGILFMVAHDDGQICKWAEFARISEVTTTKKNRSGTPTHIKCPRCGKRGRLNWARDIHAAKDEIPFTIKYIVVHKKIPGKWGKKRKVNKRERCQTFTPVQRISILKQIGRYIADPPKPRAETVKSNDSVRKRQKNGARLLKTTQNKDLTPPKDSLDKYIIK